MVEQGAERDRADEAAEEIGREIEAARAAAVRLGGAADEAGGDRLGEERADPDQRQAGEDDLDLAGEQRRGADPRQGQRRPDRRARPQPCDEPAGERRRQDRRREDEVDEADLHHAEAERRAGEDEIDVGECADKGEQDAESDAERRAQGGHAQMAAPDRQRMVAARVGPRRAFDHQRRERRAQEVQRGKGQEIAGDAEVVDQRGGAQPPDEVARDIAGDIGGEGAGQVLGGRMFAQMGEGQRECGGHAQALRDAQRGEDGEIGREGESRRRRRQRA